MASSFESGALAKENKAETVLPMKIATHPISLQLKSNRCELSKEPRNDGNMLMKLNKQSAVHRTRTQNQANSHISLSATRKDIALRHGERDACRSAVKKISVHNSCDRADNCQASLPVDSKTGENSMQDARNMSCLNLSSISQKTKGRPKKVCLVTTVKDNVKEPQPKQLKSSPLTGVEFNALTLAVEMGFRKPYEKITIKSSGNDREEDTSKQISPIEIIQQLIDYKKSCKCLCLAELSMHDLASHRMEVTLLDRHSRDFFIMGLLRCGAIMFKETRHHNNRIRNRFSYRIMNTKICQCCFLAVNNIGGKYLKNLKKHIVEHGVTSRLHGNLGRKPYHAISNSDITDVVEFINRYASNNGVPVSRRTKNPTAKSVIVLPPSDNVTSIHKKYKVFYEQLGKRTVALTSFRKVWNRHLPHIKLTVKDSLSLAKNALPNTRSPEAVASTDGDAGHSVVRQMLKTVNSSQCTDDVTRSSEFQMAGPPRLPANLPYEFGSSEMSHNQMMPFNMYLNDGNNHDAAQYGYIFTSSSLPTINHLPTNIVNGSPHQATDLCSKSSISHDSPAITQQLSPQTSVVPVKHTIESDQFAGNRNKHLLLLSSSNSLEMNSIHAAQLEQRAAVHMVTSDCLITHSDNDVHHEITRPAESSLAALSQQIHMSLFQQI